MLYKNHQKVELQKDPLYQLHEAEFTEFLKGKKYVTFDNGDRPIVHPNGTERVRAQTISVFNTVRSADGYEEDFWVYCKRPPKVLQNKDLEYDRAPITMRGTLTVPVTEKDKIFYLMYLSPSAVTKRVKSLDPKREAVAKVEQLKAKTKVDFLLTDDDYNILSEKRKRLIAKSFGIKNVDSKELATVIIELKNVIEASDKIGDKATDTQAFLEAVGKDDLVNVKANIQDAIDAGKIKFDEKQLWYYYADEEGGFARKVVSVEPINTGSETRRRATLQGYYIDNPERLKELRRVLGLETDDIDFSNVEHHSLKSWAARYTGSGKGTQEELVERCTKYYDENKATEAFDMTLIKFKKKEEE